MAVRGFPSRKEDPLIQQLLERARQEAAQSSAIGSPSMYKAAAGGGIGPVAGVLTAQVLAGARSGVAQRQAQEIADRQQKALSTATELQTRGYIDTPQGQVFTDNQGRLMRVGDVNIPESTTTQTEIIPEARGMLDAANELDSLIRSGMDDEQALQKVVSKYDVPIEELEDYMGR